MVESISIATANTAYGSLLAHPIGLAPFADRDIDILLLQEVLAMSQEDVQNSLDTEGYALAHFDQASGLAIALRHDSGIASDEATNHIYHIQPIGVIGQVALRHNLPSAQRLRSRALISSCLMTAAGSQLAVATTHPIVFARPVARANQVRAIGACLSEAHDNSVPQILGADMNHYPGPRPVDRQLATKLGMTAVTIDEPTWQIQGSKHEWLGRVGALFSHRPLSAFDAQLDNILYRGLEEVETSVIQIESDHQAVISTFILPMAH